MEAGFVNWLSHRLPTRPTVKQGVGDDAAVLAATTSDWIVTTDLLCDEIHFQLESTEPARIGRKAMAVNLSDMAAMAARPEAAFVSLLWPQDADIDSAKELYEGLISMASQFDVTIAGGDTNRGSGCLVVAVTLMGHALPKGPLLRSNAQVGDAILVTGALGGSILGHHLDFKPRVREAIYLHENYQLNSGIDISDGLSLDLSRLCQASHVGAEIDLAAVPISSAAEKLQASTGQAALEHALTDGEDFELLLTTPRDEATRILADPNAELTWIGSIIAEPGLWQRAANDRRTPLPSRGYLH